MRILSVVLHLAVVLDVAAANGLWLSKAAYNKWHQTELEQWLSDNGIPYPTPADRKQLETLVESNWNDYVVTPYNKWDTNELIAYLQQKGEDVQQTAQSNKDTLLSHVQRAWAETADRAEYSYNTVQNWILDSWSDSQLKSFADYHGIPVPQPREHDVLVRAVRENYEAVAKKAHHTFGYPGNWLYDTWTDSELKEWLDIHGFPAPQPSTRDQLIANVRRNSYLAYIQLQNKKNQLDAAQKEAYRSLNENTLKKWSNSDLKNFCDKNGLKVPQGSKADEIRALIRRQRALIVGDTNEAHASHAFSAATSKAGNDYAKATASVNEAVLAAFNSAVDSWSESRLKGFLDARSIAVPRKSSLSDLRGLVRENANVVPTGSTAWTFDDFSYEKLHDYLAASGDQAAKKVIAKKDASRSELVSAAHAVYTSASKAGGDNFASATSYLAAATEAVKSNVFDTWSDSEIKAYLDTYGISVPQGSTENEIRAYARQQATYFKYGTLTPTETLAAKAREGFWDTVEWVKTQLHVGYEAAKDQGETIQKKINDEL